LQKTKIIETKAQFSVLLHHPDQETDQAY